MVIQSSIAIGALLLAAYPAWRILRSRLAEKAKAYEARKKRAMIDMQIGRFDWPSWYKSDCARASFLDAAARLTKRKGVPDGYTQTVLAKEVNVRRLFWYVGALEARGGSWREQQMAAADQIEDWWVAELHALELGQIMASHSVEEPITNQIATEKNPPDSR